MRQAFVFAFLTLAVVVPGQAEVADPASAGGPPCLATASLSSAPADLPFLEHSVALPAANKAPCSATASCESSAISCTASGTSTCEAVDSNCAAGQRGYVRCGTSFTYCTPPCPVCTEGDLDFRPTGECCNSGTSVRENHLRYRCTNGQWVAQGTICLFTQFCNNP